MDRITHTRKFKASLDKSSYEYSDEFLYELISELTSRVEYLEQRTATLESDGK